MSTVAFLNEPSAVRAPIFVRRREQTASQRPPVATSAPPAGARPSSLTPASGYVGRESVSTRARVRVSGEIFELEVEDGVVYLRHPLWSLIGAGSSLIEAEQDLRKEASEILDALREMKPLLMSSEALQFRDYIFRIG